MTEKKWYRQTWFLVTIVLAVMLPLAFFCGTGTERL